MVIENAEVCILLDWDGQESHTTYYAVIYVRFFKKLYSFQEFRINQIHDKLQKKKCYNYFIYF